MAWKLLLAVLILAARPAAAAPVRLWSEIAGAPMGAGPEALARALRRARLRPVKVRSPPGATALREKVSFERHTLALVTYRFFEGKLYEVELRYLRGGRTRKMAAFLTRKFGSFERRRGARIYRAGGLRVTYRTPGGRVLVAFTHPDLSAQVKAAARPRRRPPEPDRGKRRGRKGRREAAVEPPRAPAPRRVVVRRAEDPALWDLLGVRRGPVTVFELKLREQAAVHLVAAGFTRDAGIPLGAILLRDGTSYRLLYLGKICAGTPVDAEPVDFRLDGRLDVAIHLRDGAGRRIALLPSDPRFAGARLIGGRFGGRNAFDCYPIGAEIQRLDFADMDQDRSLDLVLTYPTPHAGPAHDVYFFQGTDFYFRETRPGLPRQIGAR
jgi:hypothetical protein